MSQSILECIFLVKKAFTPSWETRLNVLFSYLCGYIKCLSERSGNLYFITVHSTSWQGPYQNSPVHYTTLVGPVRICHWILPAAESPGISLCSKVRWQPTPVPFSRLHPQGQGPWETIPIREGHLPVQQTPSSRGNRYYKYFAHVINLLSG